MNYTKIYKIAGFLLKLAIIILAFGFITYEILYKKNISNIYSFFISILNKQSINILIIVCVLMFINWSVELLKWRFLIKKIENINIFQSIIAVFSGITVSTITPNRIGEYGGRVFVLKPQNRWQGVVLTIVGSISQLITTLCIGIVSFLLIYPLFNLTDTLEFAIVFIAVFAFFLLLTFYFNVSLILNVIKHIKILKKLIKYLTILDELKKRELVIVLLYSILRHLVFSFQFFLLFQLCGIDIYFYQSFIITSVIFFILAAIPTIALGEFGVRGSVTLFIFGLFFKDNINNMDYVNIGVVTAAFLLWLINIAIPAIIGSIFIFKLKFFKHS